MKEAAPLSPVEIPTSTCASCHSAQSFFRNRFRVFIVEHPARSVHDIDCYSDDGRKSLGDLYRSYMRLAEEHGWEMECLYSQTREASGLGNVSIPVLSFRTQARGPALWVLSGIHGEEPAGPNALAENIGVFVDLGKKEVPMVVIPLCNPKGYSLNWRFPNTADRTYRSAENPHGGVSVGESGHLLPVPGDLSTTFQAAPVSSNSDGLTKGVLRLARTHPPCLVFDHHEDELVPGCYIYSQGMSRTSDSLARSVLTAMEGAGIPLNRDDRTRFGEPIVNGIVSCDAQGNCIQGDSIDDLLSAPRIFVDGAWQTGPGSPYTFVIETPANGPLVERMQAHAAVFRALPKLWEMAVTG